MERDIQGKDADGPLVIVYTYIVGDILHRGHLLYLRNARALGDRLVVGVLTDEAVMERKPRPAMAFDERLDLVASLECVDAAMPQKTYSPVDNIYAIRPNIMIESESHDEELTAQVRRVTEFNGGRVVIAPYYDGQSSTKIKRRIKNG